MAHKFPDISELDPSKPFVQLTRSECRECGEMEPDWRESGDEIAEQPWDGQHVDETGHARFYLWTLGRHASEVFTFSEARHA